MTNVLWFIVEQTDSQSLFIPEEVINKLHNVELDQPDPHSSRLQKKQKLLDFH